MKTERELTVNGIRDLIKISGMDLFITSGVGQTRNGKDQLRLKGAGDKIISLDDSALERVQKGDIEFLIRFLGSLTIIKNTNLSATQLLGDERVAAACATQLKRGSNLTGNKFLTEVAGILPDSVPIFYGSTAGINFAEILETSLATKFLKNRRINATLVFDYESKESFESQIIFDSSMSNLPVHLRERALNFDKEFRRRIDARLKATTDLLGMTEGLPQPVLIDGADIFSQLGLKFTLGQLLLITRMAGNAPRLFESSKKILNSSHFLEAGVDLDTPVSEIITKDFKPAGFTYYARDVRIGKFEGAVGFPLKLTDKANIYKILVDSGCLFDPETGQGVILLPLTRQRIQNSFGIDNKPVDPIALKFLAEDQPLQFQALIGSFQEACRVLTPTQAIKVGTVDNRFIIGDYFNLGGRDEEL